MAFPPDPMHVDTVWRAIVPLKNTRIAKSRLGGQRDERRQLAIAMAQDTLCAVAEAAAVHEVYAVCSSAGDVECFTMPGVTVLVLEDLGLNTAVRRAQTLLESRGAAPVNVAVLPGDLPYLRPSELASALDGAALLPRSMVRDRWGDGTTLLTATHGERLAPAFGDSSALAHRQSGAVELDLPVWSGLRRDVDTVDDLMVNESLGWRTRQVLAQRAAGTAQKVRC